jgi:hypothetical protein
MPIIAESKSPRTPDFKECSGAPDGLAATVSDTTTSFLWISPSIRNYGNVELNIAVV